MLTKMILLSEWSIFYILIFFQTFNSTMVDAFNYCNFIVIYKYIIHITHIQAYIYRYRYVDRQIDKQWNQAIEVCELIVISIPILIQNIRIRNFSRKTRTDWNVDFFSFALWIHLDALLQPVFFLSKFENMEIYSCYQDYLTSYVSLSFFRPIITWSSVYSTVGTSNLVCLIRNEVKYN